MAFETKAMDSAEWNLIKNMEMFKKAGMEIMEFDENIGKMKFIDIGAFVYYLKCIPWQINDFTIDKYYNKLEIINEIIEKNGYINFIEHRFYMVIGKL
jgi:hypothetical protein